AAVRAGRLPEERLRDAAARLSSLAAVLAAARAAGRPTGDGAELPPEVAAVARAAVRARGRPALGGDRPPVVVELDPVRTIAVGATASRSSGSSAGPTRTPVVPGRTAASWSAIP